MSERQSQPEHHRSRTGIFTDMRGYKTHQASSPEDICVERDSLVQIANDVRRRVHKWNVNYWGIVYGEDTPDLGQARTCCNCKDERYTNVFLYEGKGENGLSNVDWFILPPI